MIRRLPRLFAAVGLLLCLAPAAAFAQEKGKQPAEDPEVKLGRENAAENDKEVKLLTDPALVERVNRIGQEIAKVANEVEVPAIWGSPTVKKFQYSFKVVDDKDVNAYSLPGGFIYVHKGLLDYVRSDDELAGVLAHEVAHASHHHMIKLIKEQQKMQPWSLLAIAAAATLSRDKGESVGKIALASQLYMTAKLNTFGQEAERDADQTGIHYLRRTKYNPVGLLTFMERLALDEQNRPNVDMGIFRTHPPSAERAQSALALLRELNIAVNRRDVDPTRRAVVADVTLDGRTLSEVKMYKTSIVKLAPTDGDNAAARARLTAETLNRVFDDDLQMYELRLSKDGSKIIARGATILSIAPEDAAAQKTTVLALGTKAYDALKSLLWQDQFTKPAPRIELPRFGGAP